MEHWVLSDGSKHAFTGLAGVTADLSVTMPAKSLYLNRWFCTKLYGEVVKKHLVAAYHSDGLTHDRSPGDRKTWVVLFAFIVMGSQL